MAHRIVYKPQGIIFSSAVGSIDIDVDGEYVDVALTATGGVTVLSERYYAYGGRVTLFDLASLIESEMRWSGNAYADFTLRVYTDTTANKADSCILHVLYCDRYTVSWKSQIRKTFDAKAFSAAHPEIDIQPYYKVSTARPFKVQEQANEE